ncbi:CerR family C-terminal domain-containing protein [soil metagenome]
MADARGKLIEAGIKLFARKGPHGVSTRELALDAGVNIAGIAYHFGGKENLHIACAEFIADTVRSGVEAQMEKLPPGLSSVERLEATLAGIAQFLLANPKTASFARFVLREQMDPSPAFDVFFSKVMEPLHKRLCQLWADASGDDPAASETKIRVFGLLSQIFVFRLAEAGISRRMAWRTIGPAELALIIANVKHTCAALLAAKESSP